MPKKRTKEPQPPPAPPSLPPALPSPPAPPARPPSPKRLKTEPASAIDQSCNVKNAHPRDKGISFESITHTYCVTGSGPREYSVTGVKGLFLPSFDADLCLERMMSRMDEGGRQIGGKNDGRSREDIGLKWIQSRDFGSYVHDCIDKYYDHMMDIDPLSLSVEDRKGILYFPKGPEGARVDPKYMKCLDQFLKFETDYAKQGWHIFRTEWRVYNDLFVGSVDAVYSRTGVDGTQQYSIVDWKCTEQNIKSVNQMGLHQTKGYYPIEHLDASNIIGFAVQLNLYANILETAYAMPVDSLVIVQLDTHPTRTKYTNVFPLGRMAEEMNGIVASFREYLDLKNTLKTWDQPGRLHPVAKRMLYYT